MNPDDKQVPDMADQEQRFMKLMEKKKSSSKTGRKQFFNYKTISYEISAAMIEQKQKMNEEDILLMSPRRDHKSRKQVNKIVKIDIMDSKGNDTAERITIIPEKQKTEEDILKLTAALKRHFIFFSLDTNQLRSVIEKMIYCKSVKDEEIIPKDSSANYFFVIDEGNVDILINGEVKRQLTDGQFFGDLALLYNSPRSATVRASTEQVTMWGINRETFKTQVAHMKLSQYKENREMVENVDIFKKLTSSQKDSLASEMIVSHYHPSDIVFSQGDDANAFFILKSGELEVIKNGEIVAGIGAGKSFGENSLLEAQLAKRSATIIAKTESICLSLPRELLLKIFGQDVQAISLLNCLRSRVSQSSVLSRFTRTQQERLINQCNIQLLEEGAIVLEKGREYQQILLVLEGTIVQVEEDGTFQPSTILEWGTEESLEDRPVVPATTIKAQSQLAVTIIPFSALHQLFGQDIKSLFESNKLSHEIQMHRHREKSCQTLEISQVRFSRYLGAGSYGAVNLVRHKEKSTFLALKSISKKLINSQTALQLLKNEKEVLSFIDFPLVIQMEGISKETNFINFAIEFVDGLPFDDVLMKLDQLTEWQTCFYISQIVLMLQYLHKHGIIYRDLKAQNIICGTDGYLKMVDMGTAKFLKLTSDGIYERTFTVVGTPHFTAPEVIQQRGYTSMADYWSLGILMYEVAVGNVPFGADESDVFQVYQEILKNELEFPEWLDWEDAKDVMKKLLNKAPDGRLGGSIASFKAHKWFKLIDWDWDRLLNKKITPEFTPDSMIEDIPKPTPETEDPEYLISQIEDACKSLTTAKMFKVNVPADWDKDF